MALGWLRPETHAGAVSPEQLQEMNAIRWFHRIQLEPGVMTPGECPHTVAEATERFGIPADLHGKTVLDLGAWDGLFTFEAERRGARVTAMDVPTERGGNWGAKKGYDFAHRFLRSKAEFVPAGVFDLDPALHGKFDYVFFFGVLYHLTNPVEALQRLLPVTREACLIETAISLHPDALTHPIWEFKHGHDNDPSNYWYPTISGLAAVLRMAGWADANLVHAQHGRMTVRAIPPGSPLLNSPA